MAYCAFKLGRKQGLHICTVKSVLNKWVKVSSVEFVLNMNNSNLILGQRHE